MKKNTIDLEPKHEPDACSEMGVEVNSAGYASCYATESKGFECRSI